MRKIAVLGLGSIGHRHARNALACGASVIGFDPDPARQVALAGAGGIAAASRDEAVASGDAIVIATPSALHATDIAAAVKAGKHVLVEKPIALRPGDVADAIGEGEKNGLVVYAALNLRLHAAVKAAKALLSEQRFGDPLWGRAICSSYLPAWRPSQDHRKGYAADPRSGGVIYDDIHELDLMVHLLGAAELVGAAAVSTGRIGIAADDVACMILRHAGGVLSTIHIDYLGRPPVRYAQIGCAGGLIRIDLIARRLDAWSADGIQVIEETFPGSFDDDYVAEMKLFLDCIEGNAKPACTGREALAVLDIACQARSQSGLPQP
jgi:predicted dehydrogenase